MVKDSCVGSLQNLSCSNDSYSLTRFPSKLIMERNTNCFHVIFLDLVYVDIDYNGRNTKRCNCFMCKRSTEGKMGQFGVKWLGTKTMNKS